MDWLTFIERVVHSVLSWPVAAVVLVVVLRRSIRDLISNVRRLAMKAGGAEVQLDREVAQAVAELSVGTPEPQLEVALANSSMAKTLERLDELEQDAAKSGIGRYTDAFAAYRELEQWIAGEVSKLPPSAAESDIATQHRGSPGVSYA
jgi:hypothetical protein